MIYKILSFMVNSGYQIYTDIKTKSPDKYYHMTMSRITLLETGILLLLQKSFLFKIRSMYCSIIPRGGFQK
jgi:hypothetical protein